MFVLARAFTYASLFIGLVLVVLPGRLLAWAGAVPAPATGVARWSGALLAALGAGLMAWCVLAFAVLGRGTPAPFDRPRRLVVRGPYRFVRNPMYLGALAALAGAALWHASAALGGYAAAFALAAQAFVRWYEEPALRAAFGPDYVAYCRRVRRWAPSLRPASLATEPGEAPTVVPSASPGPSAATSGRGGPGAGLRRGPRP
jgi:protein-S-isoprenylcysteine O-methyltransferase Ste14